MKKIITILIAFAALIACQKETPSVTQDKDLIQFELGLPQTKATAESFEVGDKVSLWAVEYTNEEAPELQIGGNFLNNEQLTFNGSEWTGRAMYWSEKPCDFYAVYPYIEPSSVDSYLFDIATDQNTERTDVALGGYEASEMRRFLNGELFAALPESLKIIIKPTS